MKSFLHLHVALASLIAVSLGCGRSESGIGPDERSTQENTEYDGLTASQVTLKMVETYRRATNYMDNAEYAEHFSDANKRVPEQTHPHVTSVLFERPNRFRITRFVPAVEGPAQLITVVSDGERLLAEASDLGPQILDIRAPSEATLESVATDPLLRETLFPVPIENLYPQLSFLLAKESSPPQPARAEDRLEMLPPSPLERKGYPTVDCFRVRLPSPLGAYVYWIDRKSFLLHRLELPSEEVRKIHYADRDLGSYQLVIDFFDVAVDLEIPDSAFTLEVPQGSSRVERLEKPSAPSPPGPQLDPPAGSESIPPGDDEATSTGEEGGR